MGRFQWPWSRRAERAVPSGTAGRPAESGSRVVITDRIARSGRPVPAARPAARSRTAPRPAPVEVDPLAEWTGDRLEAAAAAVDVQVDEALGRRCRAYVGVYDGRYRIYFALDGGLRRSEPDGPAFRHPRPAAALARLLNASLEAGIVTRPEPVLNPDGSIGSGPVEVRVDQAA